MLFFCFDLYSCANAHTALNRAEGAAPAATREERRTPNGGACPPLVKGGQAPHRILTS